MTLQRYATQSPRYYKHLSFWPKLKLSHFLVLRTLATGSTEANGDRVSEIPL